MNEQKAKFAMKGWVMARVKKAGEKQYKTLWDKPIENMIVNAGLVDIADHLINDETGGFTHGAIGTSATAPAAAQTALLAQVIGRKVAIKTTEQTSIAGDTAQYVSTFTADASYAIVEYGTFDAASGPVMLNRVTFSAINLTNGDALEFTYKCQVQRA